MANFKYIAKGIDGSTIKGEIEGENERDVVQRLRRDNIYPIKITKESLANKELKFSILQRVKIKDIAIFCRQFHAIIEAGISLLECLEILRAQTENKKLRNSIYEVYEEVQKGNTLSMAMNKHPNVFPEMLVNMVETGEVSGQLDIVMARMADHYEKENKLRQKITGTMVYPIIIGIVSILVVWFLMVFVLPNFISMFGSFGVQLPLITRILLALGNWLKSYWYMPIIIVGIIYYIYKKYSRSQTGRYRIDSLKLNLPIIGPVNRKIATSRFSRTLSTMLFSGISIIEAMEIVIKVIGNAVISEGINKSMDNIRKGIGIADPIKEIGVFPPMLISMVRIGEESGSLDAMLAKTADFYDDEVESAVAKMTTLIEPIVLVLMAVVVGVIIVSIVLPMFEMFNQIGV